MLHFQRIQKKLFQLFAKTILTEQEFSLYQKVYEQANIQTLQPDLVIYLQAPKKQIKYVW